MNSSSIVSYNVNGIRAALKKGLLDWLSEIQPDVLCIQETKARPDQFDTSHFEERGYTHYWYSAEKKGYSGVGILSKTKPKHVEFGCGDKRFDSEGRVLRADFEEFSILNIYFPSGSSGEARQEVKFEFLDFILPYISELRQTHPDLIVAGDYNICHQDIDIHDPVGNKRSSGFLPEEREWLSKFFDTGFIDSFRHFHKTGDQYTWWSYRTNARSTNKGWRIDYLSVTPSLKNKMVEAKILDNVFHSDHCPIYMKIIF